jgi:hypothetical protein
MSIEGIEGIEGAFVLDRCEVVLNFVWRVLFVFGFGFVFGMLEKEREGTFVDGVFAPLNVIERANTVEVLDKD